MPFDGTIEAFAGLSLSGLSNIVSHRIVTVQVSCAFVVVVLVVVIVVAYVLVLCVVVGGPVVVARR